MSDRVESWEAVAGSYIHIPPSSADHNIISHQPGAARETPEASYYHYIIIISKTCQHKQSVKIAIVFTIQH